MDPSIVDRQRSIVDRQRVTVASLEGEFLSVRGSLLKAVDQLDSDAIRKPLDPETNSVAVILKHLGGNLRSRFTDFLATDGEKPDRRRDDEFVDGFPPGEAGRAAAIASFESGWSVLTATLADLADADLGRTVTIRGEPHTVARALARSLAHLAYHQGQVTLIARTLVGPERWKVITIPRGGSREHDAAAGYAFDRSPRNVTSTTGVHGMSEALARFAAAYSAGSIRAIDLTQVLSPDFPTLVLPPHLGQAWPFRLERISRYDEAGPGWYWNNFSCSEHVGTHFDAPAHWITGRDLPRNTVDTIDVRNFIAPVAVVDASDRVAGDEDWLLTVDYLREWEGRHGRIPPGGWLAFRTDWSRRIVDPASFVNMREDGAHSPGPTQETVEWLIHERNVLGFAVETINTDAGQSYRWPLPYPCHTLMHGAGRFGLQCLRNLDQLPPTGAMILAAPLKILEGSGSPLRVIALV